MQGSSQFHEALQCKLLNGIAPPLTLPFVVFSVALNVFHLFFLSFPTLKRNDISPAPKQPFMPLT